MQVDILGLTGASTRAQVRWAIDRKAADDPHAKASLLLQAHLGRTPLPISDYFTDTRSVLDNSLRLLQVPRRPGCYGSLAASLRGFHTQCCCSCREQQRWHDP